MEPPFSKSQSIDCVPLVLRPTSGNPPFLVPGSAAVGEWEPWNGNGVASLIFLPTCVHKHWSAMEIVDKTEGTQ